MKYFDKIPIDLIDYNGIIVDFNENNCIVDFTRPLKDIFESNENLRAELQNVLDTFKYEYITPSLNYKIKTAIVNFMYKNSI